MLAQSSLEQLATLGLLRLAAPETLEWPEIPARAELLAEIRAHRDSFYTMFGKTCLQFSIAPLVPAKTVQSSGQLCQLTDSPTQWVVIQRRSTLCYRLNVLRYSVNPGRDLRSSNYSSS
jgi:hypothetical protein